MIIVDFLPENFVIRFAVQYPCGGVDARAIEENRLLRINLEQAGLVTRGERRSLFFERSSPTSWSKNEYGVSDYCFHIPAQSFSSFDDMIEKALAGLTEFSVEPGKTFNSTTDIKTGMYAFDSCSYYAASKQPLVNYYATSKQPLVDFHVGTPSLFMPGNI